MAIYQIPIVWQLEKTYEVEANYLQEAVEKAMTQFYTDPNPDGEYVGESFELDDKILADNYPDEEYDEVDALVIMMENTIEK